MHFYLIFICQLDCYSFFEFLWESDPESLLLTHPFHTNYTFRSLTLHQTHFMTSWRLFQTFLKTVYPSTSRPGSSLIGRILEISGTWPLPGLNVLLEKSWPAFAWSKDPCQSLVTFGMLMVVFMLAKGTWNMIRSKMTWHLTVVKLTANRETSITLIGK